MDRKKPIIVIIITILTILVRNSLEYFLGIHNFFGNQSYILKEVFSILKKIIFYAGPIIVYMILSKKMCVEIFDGIGRRFHQKRVYALWIIWFLGLVLGKTYFPKYFPNLDSGWNLFFYILIINSLVEEGVFRGFIISSLQKFYSKLKANFIQAGLFAIIHTPLYATIILQNQNAKLGLGLPLTLLVMLADTFVLGMIRGYIKQKTGSLRPSIILHSIHNGVVLFFMVTM